MAGNGRRAGFTLIEMLTVIGIIMLVMALALPNFLEMMRSQAWHAAVGKIQVMVMRARALATNERKDFSVEFLVNDSDNDDAGTTIWIESEVNDLERMPDLWELEHEVGGFEPLVDFLNNTFRPAGGSWTSSPVLAEFTCAQCGYRWDLYGWYNPGAVACPSCGHGYWGSHNLLEYYYYNFTYDATKADDTKFADNARQSEVVDLSGTITIDLSRSAQFINWDMPLPDRPYGKDAFPDLRIAVNGTLAQTLPPVICLKQKGAEQRLAVTVVRCTGRVLQTDLP
ncbi:MAG TPA: prepilin-type N-terminal cleavage/methylation domain-containing protein [Planctomycetota bacterium]|nr:prepilin-type N-terminal cleavage/methylation domain-containing protein [Planctomycetota bacterium]